MSTGRSPRANLVDAAVEVFAVKGYAAATVQEVADRVGVRKASLYKHIDSKEDLLFWILDAAHEQTTALMASVAELDLQPLESLHEYLRRHVVWYLDNVPLLTVFFREWSAVTGERADLVLERRRGYDRYIRDLITACQAAGVADPGLDPRYASFYVLGAINAVPDWFHAAGGDTPEAAASNVADLAVAMITGTRPRPVAA